MVALSSVPRLDVYTIRLFIAVAEERSIARAAEREGIAASALSRRLSDLEHSLKAPLLVRSARGIELTEAGKYVLKRGHDIEKDLKKLVEDVLTLSGSVTGNVRLVANPSSIIGYLPERLRQFTDAYPEVSIELSEHRSREVVRACLDDRADVGVAVAMEVSRGLDTWRLASDPLTVLMPADHPLAEREPLRFGDVLECGLVGVQPGGALDQSMREAAQIARLPFRPKVSVEGFDSACRMVEAGLGVAIVPTSAATAYAGTARFMRRGLDEPWASRELWIYALQKQPRPTAVEALLTVLRR